MMEQIPALQYYPMGEDVTAFSSTRQGGYSKGPYSEFNINRYCGDQEEDIRRNREALCRLLAIDDGRLLMPHQVHQTKTAVVDEEMLSLTAEARRQRLEGVDALMTDIPGVCIGVSTADCIPVLLYDPVRHAACAVHAGWRGTVKRIVEKAVAKMTDVYGSRPCDMIAQIGPGISLDSFEVGDEVYEAFASEGFIMDPISKKYETTDGIGKKWHIDLPACNRQQLIDSGVTSTKIAISSVCTVKQSETFFSARRLGIHSGRIFTGIIIRCGTDVERHPLQPFLPENATVLFLGSFPPQRKRWCMDFYYPNFINDHWRIEGEVFFADRNHFVDSKAKRFKREDIIAFCKEKGIAFYDTATAVRRLKDNASDKFLEVVEPTDIRALLRQLPHCRTIVTTGEKATDTICASLGIDVAPKVNTSVPIPGTCNIDGQQMMLYRLPSSSRAYPLAFDKKVEAYRRMFEQSLAPHSET